MPGGYGSRPGVFRTKIRLGCGVKTAVFNVRAKDQFYGSIVGEPLKSFGGRMPVKGEGHAIFSGNHFHPNCQANMLPLPGGNMKPPDAAPLIISVKGVKAVKLDFL